MRKNLGVGKLVLATVSAMILLLQSGVSNASSSKTIAFSGYNWNVKNSYFGPGPNWWTDDPNDVYVDANGALHLSIVNHNGTWYSSEAYLSNSLGYGTYTFTTNGNVDSFDPNVVLGLFMYQDDTHEIDTEYSRWGDANAANLGYSVQPAGIQGNNYQFNVNLDHSVPVVNTINWQPDKIVFNVSQNGNLIKEWVYTGANNFVPGGEFADMNFWLMKGLAPTDGKNAEAVINNFSFTPYVAPSSTSTSTTTSSIDTTASTTTTSSTSAPVDSTTTIIPTTTTISSTNITSSSYTPRRNTRKSTSYSYATTSLKSSYKTNYVKKGVNILY